SIISLAADTSNNMQNGTDTSNNSQMNTQTNNLSANEINNLNQQKDELDDKLEEANSKLEYVQGEISSSLLEIQQLSDKIIQYETENEELANQLSTLETSIAETTELL